MDNIKIKHAEAKDQEYWDEYVLNHPKGLSYQLYAWQEAVKNAYGFNSFSFIAEDNNKIKGILPVIQIRLPLSTGKLVSLPYCDAGGPLADDAETEKLLINYALKNTDQKQLTIRSAHEFAGIHPDRTINKQKVRMILPLPASSDKLLASLKAKVRSQVKKAYKNDLTTAIGSINLLNDFYKVFSENMRDLGSPVHSRKWIYSILKCYGNRAHISVVYMPDGQPAAAGLILCHPNLVSIPWASSLRRFNKSNPNMMLYWTFLKFASDNGYPAFDFGRSTPNEGTYRFKKQWGAHPHPLHWIDLNCRENKPGNSPSVARAMAESIIMKLPVSGANALGSLTRKYISL